MSEIDELRELVRDCITLTHETLIYHKQRMADIENLFLSEVNQNAELLSSADERLDRANEMVLKLTESINGMKDLCKYVSGEYVEHINQACKSRDIAQVENSHMRRELETLHLEMFDALKELARRPTINNSNKTSENQ